MARQHWFYRRQLYGNAKIKILVALLSKNTILIAGELPFGYRLRPPCIWKFKVNAFPEIMPNVRHRPGFCDLFFLSGHQNSQ